MIVLAIDTSTRWAGVGVLGPGGRIASHTWRSEQNHGRELMPAIEATLSEAGVNASDVTHIGVAIGPGGFSAVRVGMSAAIGIAIPRDIPLAGISTHQIEAAPFFSGSSVTSPLFSVLPAGRGEVAWARFEGSMEPVETGVSSPADFIAGVPRDAIICGEAAQDLTSYFRPESFVGMVPPTRAPGTLISLTTDAVATGKLVIGAALKPIYARPPSISRPRPPV